MKVWLTVVFCFCCLATTVCAQTGQRTATQTVTIIVTPTNHLSLSSGPIVLMPGGATNPDRFAVDGRATYSIATSGTTKISADLGPTFDDAISLVLNMSAPPGATSYGPTLLSSRSRDLVTGISSLSQDAFAFTYSARVKGQSITHPTGEIQTVTLTITN